MSLYLQDEPIKDYEINILPMIDVIFAILTFFIVSTLYLTRVEDVPVDLPKADTSSTQVEKFINVTIDKNNIIYINSNTVDLNDLPNQIKLILQDKPNMVVLVSSDKANSYGIVINVLDKLRQIKDLKVGLRTE